jgi:glycosyltransferase involved in cell wall biosynthesis
MQVALVTHKVTRVDGQGRVNLEIARGCLRRGWKVTLIASEVDPQLLEDTNVSWIRIPVGRLPTELIRNQYFAVVSAIWLHIRRREFDVVHVNGFITWARSDTCAAHFVHSAWMTSAHREQDLQPGSWIRNGYQRLYTAVNARLERRAYRRCWCAIAVSHQISGQLQDIGIPEEHIRIIPNGVDVVEFHPGSGQKFADVPGGAIAGLFVGDLHTSRKNLKTVLEALRLCPANIHLVVVGGIERSRFPALAESLGVAGRVHFLGRRSDVADLMRRADFVVYPSLYEPSGLVLLEGMASGVPVITSRNVGAVEAIDEGSAIVLEDPENTSAMAASITELAESALRREEIGASGRACALRLDRSEERL